MSELVKAPVHQALKEEVLVTLRYPRLLLSMVLLMVAAACGGGGAQPTAALEEQVRAASAAWDEAHNSGNAAGLMELYANDAVSMPYYGPAIEGKAAIGGDFRAFFSDFDATHETTIVGLQIADDWGDRERRVHT